MTSPKQFSYIKPYIYRVYRLILNNELPMISVLVFIVTHWTRLMLCHDLRLSSSHDFLMLLHCVVSQP